MNKTTKTIFDTYNSADGLSQDEFTDMFATMSMRYDEMVGSDMITLIGYLKRIIVAKERQIADLYEELYNKSIENHK